LAGRFLNLLGLAISDKSVVRLEFLQRFVSVVDESETSGLATTIVGSHPENGDGVLLNLVGFGELLAEVILGNVL